jgi:hypothetical protein
MVMRLNKKLAQLFLEFVPKIGALHETKAKISAALLGIPKSPKSVLCMKLRLKWGLDYALSKQGLRCPLLRWGIIIVKINLTL